MPWSNSVFRRYNPPTCTLEISVKRSILSWWTGKYARKHLSFELIFYDPQSSPEQQFIIRGDALALESLYEAVKEYRERFFNRDRTETNTDQLLLESDSLESGQHDPGILPAPSPDRSSPSEANFKETLSIHLQSEGVQNNQLYLGLLATEESGPMIQLGNLQLLDLATALEECTQDLMAIAPSQPPLKTMPWSLVKWLVGAIALLTLGLTAGIATRSDNYSSPPSLSQPTSESIPLRHKRF